jgi:ribosomal protein S27AE
MKKVVKPKKTIKLLTKAEKQVLYIKLAALRKLCTHTGLISPFKHHDSSEEKIKHVPGCNSSAFIRLALGVLSYQKSTDINRIAAGYILDVFYPDWRKEVVQSLVGSAIERRSHEVYLWKRDVLNRDGRRCRKCGDTKRLEAHHILRWVDEPNARIDRENGITLCKKCHDGEHGKRTHE